MTKTDIISVVSVRQMSQALINTKRFWGSRSSRASSLFKEMLNSKGRLTMVTRCFPMDTSPQGFEYWRNVIRNSERHEH